MRVGRGEKGIERLGGKEEVRKRERRNSNEWHETWRALNLANLASIPNCPSCYQQMHLTFLGLMSSAIE